MLGIFKSKPKPLIGLDIDCSSLQWVELAQDGQSRLILERCCAEPLQAGWVVAGHIENFDEVAAALRRLLRTSGSRTQDVALAMPDSAVVRSKIQLPSDAGEAELQRQVAIEVERLTGRPLAEMSVEHAVQGRAEAAEQAAEQTVLIVAADKEKMQDRQGLAESAGLNPVVVDAEAEASLLAASRLARAGSPALASSLVALLQVDSDAASLHVSHRGELVHASRQSLQGDRLIPLTALADALVSQLEAYWGKSSDRAFDSVFLAGGASLLPGLHDAIKRQTLSDCVLVDPFRDMLLGKSPQANPLQAAGRAGMLTACGLALRRFHGAC